MRRARLLKIGSGSNIPGTGGRLLSNFNVRRGKEGGIICAERGE